MQKNILITGAAKRIGRAIALKLANDGWNIAIHYNQSEQDANDLAAAIRDLGQTAALVKGDLSTPADVKSLFAKSREALGPITALVNNASLFEKDILETLTEDSFSQHMNTNLLAPALLTQAFAEQTDLPAQSNVNIVNIIDQRVHNLRPDFLSYTLSKSALWTLTQTTAMSLAPRIRVNAIGPGPTLQSKRQSKEQFSRQAQQVPLKRGATPNEIANGVLFFTNSSSITGEFIAMDGGQHLPSSNVSEEE